MCAPSPPSPILQADRPAVATADAISTLTGVDLNRTGTSLGGVQAGDALTLRATATDKTMTVIGDYAATVRSAGEVAVDAELASIARRALNIQTLSTRKMDSLDFHEVAVWQVLAALRLAHRMGRKDRGE